MRTANLKNHFAGWILSLLIICTAWGDIIYVDPNDSIQEAIETAFYGDTVEVAAGTYHERITLKDGVAVIGAGDDVTVIDGDAGGAVVTSNGCDANTVLEGFTITDGNAPNGGGMYNVNSSPTVSNCTFSGNTTDNGDAGDAGMPGDNAGHGGGMYNNNSSPFVSNCIFQGNTTGAGGAGGVSMGPSMPGYAGGNGGNGAGIYNTNNSSAILLNCIFTGNAAVAGGDGGTGGDAVAYGMQGGNGGSGGDGGAGGGVYNDNSTATMINCIFNSNSAGMGGNGGNGGNAFEVNPGKGGDGGSGGDGGDGGGIYNNNCSPVVTNCTLYGNSSGEGGLGGVGGTGEPAGDDGADGSNGVGGGMYNETSSPAVTNCILWSDWPDEIYNSSSSPTVTHSDVEGGYTGTGNIDEDPLFANASGGDFHLLLGSLCIDAGTNSAPSLPATDFEGHPRIVNGIVDMGADEYIGGRASSPSPADGATKVSIDVQLSWTAGVGALSHDVWFSTENPPAVLIANDITDTNTDPGALEYGVTYYWQVDENTSEGTVTGDVWSFRTEIWEIWVDDDYWDGGENDGHTWGIDAFDNIGAGIERSQYGTTVHVASGMYYENITLKNGVAVIGAGEDVTIIDGGAGDSVVTSDGCDANTVLEGFTITNGRSTYGGGMLNHVSSPMVTNCIFSGNFAASNGGGMYNSDSSPTVTNSTFRDNSAYWDGGGMYNNGSRPTVTGCTFSDNSADSHDGGGMWNYNSSPTVTGCTFSGNTAERDGGGMLSVDGSSPTMTNCTFAGNKAASWGGGMSNHYNSSPTVTNCTFSGNTAVYGGGGIDNYNISSPTVTNCTFSVNEANRGGGMSNHYNSSPTLTSCTFSKNSAGHGGGMYNSDSSPTVTNSTFRDNSAYWDGGGMYNNGSRPTVTGCTFSDNSAYSHDGGGMYNEDSSPMVTNCILWGDEPNEISNSGSSPSVTYCDVQGGWEGEGNIDADPLFIASAINDFHLMSEFGRVNTDPSMPIWSVDTVTSPCIDAGDPNMDVGNEPEGNGGRINMGAYGGTYQASKSSYVETFEGDVNGDGKVDFKDIAIVAGNWLAGTEPE